MEIRNDYKKGLSYTEIGKKYCIDPRTAKKYEHSDSKLVYKLKKQKTSKLDKYKQQIDMWLEETPFSAVRIKEKLDEIGSENSQFQDFCEFYGFNPILCRPYRGQTKCNVERTVQYVSYNFMSGIKYTSLDDLNNQAMEWNIKVNGKIHSTTGKITREMLAQKSYLH